MKLYVLLILLINTYKYASVDWIVIEASMWLL